MSDMIDKDFSLKLVESFSNADGISGYESVIAEIFSRRLNDIGMDIGRDYMGNITGTLPGEKNDSPRIMITGHMDEIGMVVQSIEENGLLNFIVHGSWWTRLMLQSPVRIKTSSGIVPGVISSTSSYFGGADLQNFESKKSMYIDVGASSREEAMNLLGIRPGDPVAFDSTFRPTGIPNVFFGKAFDDRLSLAAIIDIMRTIKNSNHPNTVMATATVQEEVGRRGAAAASEFSKPDVTIIIEGPPADDIPLKKHISQCRLGKGVHIRRLEPGMIGNAGLYRFVTSVAREAGIKFQEAVSPIGSTDGAVIHKSGTGIPTIMLGVPVRYAHSHNGMFHFSDYEETVRLMVEVLKRMDMNIVNDIRNHPYG